MSGDNAVNNVVAIRELTKQSLGLEAVHRPTGTRSPCKRIFAAQTMEINLVTTGVDMQQCVATGVCLARAGLQIINAGTKITASTLCTVGVTCSREEYTRSVVKQLLQTSCISAIENEYGAGSICPASLGSNWVMSQHNRRLVGVAL